MANNILNQELQSKVINFLRFPLIVGVVLVHNHTSGLTVRGVEMGMNSSDLPVFYYSCELFSEVIGRIASPLFFFMSGFLFFLNVKKMTGQVYKSKLHARMKTLLIPFLLWNTAAAIFFFTVRRFGIFTSPQPPFNFQYFIDNFWGKINEQGTAFFPVAYQFWFIRDLMVVVLLTPLIYFLVKYAKVSIVVILGILWFFAFWFMPEPAGFRIVSLFSFTAGAYFGINKRNLLDDFGKIRNLSFILYPIIVLVDLFTKESSFQPYIHKAGLVIGIVFCFNFVALLFEKKIIKPTPFLTTASFFVFAIHDPFLLMNVQKISFLIFKPESDFLMTSLYFINVIIVVLSALFIYWVLRKFLPRFTAVITGGRL